MPHQNSRALKQTNQRLNTEGRTVDNMKELPNLKRIGQITKYRSSPIPQDTTEYSSSHMAMNMSRANTTSVMPEYHTRLKGAGSINCVNNNHLNNSGNMFKNTDGATQQYSNILNCSRSPLQGLTTIYPTYNVGYPCHNTQSQYSPYPYMTFTTECVSNDGYLGESFPPYFNPRAASNMSHKEKVNNWIEKVPIFETEEDIWESECYESELPMNWEEKEFDQPSSYFINNTISLATSDELLYHQGKKIDSLVRAMYHRESEVVRPAKEVLDETQLRA